ncbi:VOC family protein [Kineococcus sp. TBRC 1896]|uniref:VOC family protein n=1 Tax=Kineococcus mangrovi TaxID=1660183 RepID=A0ABV4I5E0_9ACTN
MKVTPVRFTRDVAAMRRFLSALGLAGTQSSEDGSWVSLEAAGGGEVGLHDVATAAAPREAGTTDLAFSTTEPLETVAARLQDAGFPARVDGRVLHVTDPDERDVQVHGAELDLHGYSEGD